MIKGLVFDQNGEPINGVHVFYVDPITGENLNLAGTTTQSIAQVWPGGFFELEFIPNGNLAFTHIGFKNKLIGLPSENTNAPFSYWQEVTLEPKVYDLPPVEITPEIGKRKGFLILAGLALAYMASKD